MTEAAHPIESPSDEPIWRRIHQLVVRRVLHLNDTPHRIAFGVALGFLVGATPTIGIQMIIYIALAALLGANKVSGILPVWISNPLTAVPLYYGNWRLGHWLLTGETTGSTAMQDEIANALQMIEEESIRHQLFNGAFWRSMLDALSELGLELWVGSLVVGGLISLAAYWGTRRAVALYRARAGASPSKPSRTADLA